MRDRVDKIFDMLPRYYHKLTIKDINGLIHMYSKMRHDKETFSKRLLVEKELVWLRMQMFMHEVNEVYR